MSINIFKIGDKVKLKDYSKYNDWRRHDHQTAIIKEKSRENGGFDWRIQWKDGECSCVLVNDLVLIGDINNTLINKKVKCIDGVCKGQEGIIKHIGILNGQGIDTSVWANWNNENFLCYLDISIVEVEGVVKEKEVMKDIDVMEIREIGRGEVIAHIPIHQ